MRQEYRGFLARQQSQTEAAGLLVSSRGARYFVKNHGVLFAALVDGCAIAAHLQLWRLRTILVQRKPDRDPPWYLWDLIRHSVFVAALG